MSSLLDRLKFIYKEVEEIGNDKAYVVKENGIYRLISNTGVYSDIKFSHCLYSDKAPNVLLVMEYIADYKVINLKDLSILESNVTKLINGIGSDLIINKEPGESTIYDGETLQIKKSGLSNVKVLNTLWMYIYSDHTLAKTVITDHKFNEVTDRRYDEIEEIPSMTGVVAVREYYGEGEYKILDPLENTVYTLEEYFDTVITVETSKRDRKYVTKDMRIWCVDYDAPEIVQVSRVELKHMLNTYKIRVEQRKTSYSGVDILKIMGKA